MQQAYDPLEYELELERLDRARRARSGLLNFTTYTFPDYQVNWHHRVLCRYLNDFVEGKIKRLMVFAPPRTGKSEIVSRRLPAYILGRNPDVKIISASYSADLASRMNRDVQRIIDTPAYEELFPGTKLFGKSTRAEAEGSWLRNSDIFEIVNRQGIFRSAGVGGGITGMGGNCFPAGTLVHTEIGLIDIAVLYRSSPPRVLSFNHQTGGLEYCKVTAAKLSFATDFASLQTQTGKQLVATSEHRIYDEENRTYRPINAFIVGNRLKTVTTASHFELHSLPERLRAAAIRGFKSLSQRLFGQLLRPQMLCNSSRHQESSSLPFVRSGDPEQDKEILQRMSRENLLPEIETRCLSDLQNVFSASFAPYGYLFKRMCRLFTLQTNAGALQLELSTRQGIRSSFQEVSSTYTKARQFLLRYLLNEGSACCSSYRPQTRQQPNGQSDNSLSGLPYETPQVSPDTISTIKNFSTASLPVYDIQVEGNHNFFANGILVHNCIIIDDPIKNQKEADSLVYRDGLWEWYLSTLYTRLEKNGGICLTLTRWHEDDLAGRLLQQARENKQADQWVVVNLPMLCEAKTEDDPRELDEPLWPDKYDFNTLLTMRATLGSRTWNAMHQQRPAPEKGMIVNREWWRFYKELPKDMEVMIQAWDLAFVKSDSSDFVAGVVLGKIGANIYLIDLIHDRLSFTGSLTAVRNLTRKWSEATAKYVEKAANGAALIDTLRSEIPGLIAVPPLGSKVARAHAVAPRIESGNVWLPDPSIAPWIHKVIEEWTAFPAGANVDIVDAMSHGIAKLMEMKATDWLPISIVGQNRFR